MKKTIIAALLATLAASPAAYAEKIGVTIANSNPWLTLVRNGMQAKVKTMKGVDAQFEDAQDDIGRQLNHIQNFIAQTVDALVVVTNTDRDIGLRHGIGHRSKYVLVRSGIPLTQPTEVSRASVRAALWASCTTRCASTWTTCTTTPRRLVTASAGKANTSRSRSIATRTVTSSSA